MWNVCVWKPEVDISYSVTLDLLFLRASHPINLGFSSLARLGGQQGLELLLSLPPNTGVTGLHCCSILFMCWRCGQRPHVRGKHLNIFPGIVFGLFDIFFSAPTWAILYAIPLASGVGISYSPAHLSAGVCLCAFTDVCNTYALLVCMCMRA